MNIFKKIFKTKKEVDIVDKKQCEDLFTCHYCKHQFETTPKMIFPTSVRLLYKDQYVSGKGVMCPKCNEVCIFG